MPGTRVVCLCMRGTSNQQCRTPPWHSITSTTHFLLRWQHSLKLWWHYENLSNEGHRRTSLNFFSAQHAGSPGWRAYLPVLPAGNILSTLAINWLCNVTVCHTTWRPAVAALQCRKRAWHSCASLSSTLPLPLVHGQWSSTSRSCPGSSTASECWRASCCYHSL